MMVNWAAEPIRTMAGVRRIRRKSSIRSTAPIPNIVRAKNPLFQGWRKQERPGPEIGRQTAQEHPGREVPRVEGTESSQAYYKSIP
jgi:hypothetical protein